MEKRGISKLDLKRRNRMQILKTIREYGPISRVDVASTLEITRAAVTIITNEMIEEGVLIEIGEAPVNAEKLQKGRRKILIDINVNSRFALGATVDEKEVSVGLTNLNSEILDKSSMVIDDRTTSKDIINYIIKASNTMIENSALTKDKILGLGVGVVPSMWGKLKIFYKDGVLDFNNFIEKLSTGLDVNIQCGNAVGLMALANNDFKTQNGYQTNTAFIHNGNQVNLAIINKNELSSDYISYTSMIEKYIVSPNGKELDGYPNGSVKAELSRPAMLSAFCNICSSEKTPILWEIIKGDKKNINVDNVFMALMRGEEPVKNLVDSIIAKYAVLINNIAVSHFAKKIVLHNFKLNEKQFDYVKREMIRLISEEIVDKVVLSKLEGKSNFLGGCALIIQNGFYNKGGLL
ncbi:MAG: MarR family winged helix-turn-helix transcriptional regulator [Ruminococcus sp.]|nr:MarR family winged helix-turn-helix transcriptional regulator [Ruminococcus sp.]MDE7097651.1 MarR family winged helix-turn-helix transcriptional regulator [Ruminococcus sp.]